MTEKYESLFKQEPLMDFQRTFYEANMGMEKISDDVNMELKTLYKTNVWTDLKIPPGIFDIRAELLDSIFKMKAYVLAEDIETKTETLKIKYPKTWWEHFKYDNFPQWLLDIFPVEYETETKECKFTAKAFYPNAKFTPHLGDPVVKVFAY